MDITNPPLDTRKNFTYDESKVGATAALSRCARQEDAPLSAELSSAMIPAIETINPQIPSTLIATALCKMADDGQIRRNMLDSSRGSDDSVAPGVAPRKSIPAEVAGRADISNMLTKQLEYLAGGLLSGVVLGARVPIVLTSRADRAEARSASCAIVKRLVAHRLAAAIV